MNIIRKIFIIISKTVALIILIALLVISASGVSPVYRFVDAVPFNGPDIYNPYSGLDTAFCWKRANFHTHTRVEGIMNECEMWPGEVYAALEKFGYDIVTFSNHNELTKHPFDSSLQVNVYEHGYNLFKYHKLVFGAEKVKHFDNLVPIFAFQKQFQLDFLQKGADFIQMNHPLRTNGTSKGVMEKLSGYRLMELDSGRSTENEYWDWALSAGRYSHALANDDLHYPDRSSRIAVRCNFLCCPTARYEDIKSTLLDGCHYSMRVPNYGDGDWDVKYAKNKTLPFIKNIGLKDSTLYISLSQTADSIKVTGQNHATLLLVQASDTASYTMMPTDPYARMTAYFPEGEVIYTNAFARYDARIAESPYKPERPKVNIILTLLYNLFICLICGGIVTLIHKLLSRK